MTVLNKVTFHLKIFAQAHFPVSRPGSSQISVSPVDADTVSFPFEYRLIYRTGPKVRNTVFQFPVIHHRLIIFVYGQLGRCFEIYLHLMRFPILRANLISDITDRRGHQIEIVRQQRRSEDDIQDHRPATKRIKGLCRQYIYRKLFCIGRKIIIGRLFSKQSEIYISPVFFVVTMRCNNVLTGLQGLFDGFAQFQQDTVFPGITGFYDLNTIDVQLENIIVGIFQVYRCFTQIFFQLESPAYPNVFGIPSGSQMLHFFRPESSLSFFPILIVIHRSPVTGRFAFRIIRLPFLQIGHREYRLESLLLPAHKTVSLPIHP